MFTKTNFLSINSKSKLQTASLSQASDSFPLRSWTQTCSKQERPKKYIFFFFSFLIFWIHSAVFWNHQDCMCTQRTQKTFTR